MSALRPAAVAGTFYPANAGVLAADVGELLDGVDGLEPRFTFPKAVIAPHAGYIYSGPVAAHAYDALSPARGIVKRVVLLGPVHRVPIRGLALPDAEAFETPLGRITLDPTAVQALADLPQVVVSDRAHALEHSLEVQLPFLQRVLGTFALVPLAVGDASVREVAEVITRLWGGAETLIVVSTDMSHYHPYLDATRIDSETVARIKSLATDIRHEQACGATPLNGLLQVAREKGIAIRLLAACNSGDTAGGRDRVVGYSAFALYEGAPVSVQDAGRTLIALARAAIARRLGADGVAAPPTDAPLWLRQAGATFVTLTRSGKLRGCIGSLEARRALGDDVVANAISAAFSDPRFAPLSARRVGRHAGRGVAALDAQADCLRRRGRTARSHPCRRGRLDPGVERQACDLPAAGLGDDPRQAAVPRRTRRQGGAASRYAPCTLQGLALSRDEMARSPIWRRSDMIPESKHPGRWWHALDDGRVQCDLCPRDCRLHEGQRGLCFVRQMEGGQMLLTTYGRSSGFCVDPIEKKPLNQFYPGSSVLSFGTAGCNLACKFCQNWDISKSREMDTLMDAATPEAHRGGRRATRLQESSPLPTTTR